MQAHTAVFGNKLRKERIEAVQINLGDKCNQVCSHCHINASPQGTRNMDRHTAEKIIEKLSGLDVPLIEFTGGTPELNPNFRIFVEALSTGTKQLAVRTSLTVLDHPDYAYFADLYQKHRIKIVASLPSVHESETDLQRGKGVFHRSIKMLKRLNTIGYGTDELTLDLVYNPAADSLPRNYNSIEEEYRQILRDTYGIFFNALVTITNSPVGRFRKYLEDSGRTNDYLGLLSKSFNPATLQNIMCRHLLSVDYAGHVYDCDFNLALGSKIPGYEEKRFWEIDFGNFSPDITFGEQCYACTAGKGSSCHGMPAGQDSEIRKGVKLYYGSVLSSSADLKTSACCASDAVPPHVGDILRSIAQEIQMKSYGCGSPIPPALDGLKVLDLGCGTGRDSYILSKLVGEHGFVYGIDMTGEQIAVAQKYIKEQAGRFNYSRPNVAFIHDCIENMGNHFPDESLDLIVSNCVVNLVENKETVIKHLFRILKTGGEFYFSDVYSDRRVPEHLRKDPVLYGECLGGALYYKDFERIARMAGFADPRVVSIRELDIRDGEMQEKIGNIAFYSITYRLWKIVGLEEGSEDYGHVACYRGGIPYAPDNVTLDLSCRFRKDRPERVCGNTALMLSSTRLGQFFEVQGDFQKHLGPFDCRHAPLTSSLLKEGSGCC